MTRGRGTTRARLAPLLLLGGCTAAGTAPASIDWREFTPALFNDARAGNRLVLLDVGTGWCHWCHVMEETTWRDPEVVALLGRHYLAAQADADARVDLANRYEEYGWPATIVFDAKGVELVKLRGYVEPRRMAALLQACIDDPTPGPSARREASISYATTSALDDDLRRDLERLHVASYDPTHEGFGTVLKYLPEWSVEHDLELARRGDRDAEKRARATLTANLKLIDAAWGGVYQYSHGGDWGHPHFEKIMSFQALDLRLYAQAFALFGDPAYERAARDVRRYLVTFLRRPDGAFYASQDADLVRGEHGGEYFALDDAGRRARGMPRIDQNVYARENGWAIEALALFHALSGDPDALAEAEAAARVMLATRRIPEGPGLGGFRHGEDERDAHYLGDTLAMGAALLELSLASGDLRAPWLDAAIAAADCIDREFGAADDDDPGGGAAGYPNALPIDDPMGATGSMPQPQRDENLALARFANRLHRITGEERFARMRERALRYLVTPEIARRFPTAAVLLVANEVATEPLHVTVVGPHADPAARALFARASRLPTRARLIQWWSPREDPPLPGGAIYPALDEACAYLCTSTSCSPPVTDVPALEVLLATARP